MPLLPDTYEVPEKAGVNMKFKPGENRFRIIKLLLAEQGWYDDEEGKPKPIAAPTPDALTKAAQAINAPIRDRKHVWFCLVWNYGESAIQLLTVSQKGIQEALAAVDADTDWPELTDIDVKITRTGEGRMNTEYTVRCNPKATELPPEATDALVKLGEVDMEVLFQKDGRLFPEE